MKQVTQMNFTACQRPHNFVLTISVTKPLFSGNIFNAGQCDIQSIPLPENAEEWSCDQPINQQKVPRNTRCSLTCFDGHDLIQGTKKVGPSTLTQDRSL